MGNFEQFFNQIAEDLDLTDTEETTITSSYNAVGNFLVGYPALKEFSPDVFVQGSMRLGTVVKPLKKDDYDIDLVCELNDGCRLEPRDIKHLIGGALKSRYKDQLEEEHGRCWTLDYKAKPPYHIDVLSGVSISNGRVKAVAKNEFGEYKWLYTNPKGFADWFLGLKKKTIVENNERSVEPVKKISKKSVLQRAVQLIKRNRDVYFKEHPDDGPASVIITALTGLSYNGEDSIEEILKNGPIQWISHIRVLNDDNLSIKIPSLPDDDYADKWNEDGPKVVDSFLRWHRQLILDLDYLFSRQTSGTFLSQSKTLFSDSSIDRIVESNGKIINSLNESFSKNLHPMIVNYAHPLFPHARTLPKDSLYRAIPEISVSVMCRVYSDRESAENFSDNNELEFKEYSPILKKNKWLSFKAKINVRDWKRHTYYVKWQITNTGVEASNSKNGNQLRGDFSDVKESNLSEYIHTESTLYSGTHFVQFFVFKWEFTKGKLAEVCVSKSDLITVNIGAD